jgi:hypothetical protein
MGSSSSLDGPTMPSYYVKTAVSGHDRQTCTSLWQRIQSGTDVVGYTQFMSSHGYTISCSGWFRSKLTRHLEHLMTRSYMHITGVVFLIFTHVFVDRVFRFNETIENDRMWLINVVCDIHAAGVSLLDWSDFGDALLRTLRESFVDEYTSAIDISWRRFYSSILRIVYSCCPSNDYTGSNDDPDNSIDSPNHFEPEINRFYTSFENIILLDDDGYTEEGKEHSIIP